MRNGCELSLQYSIFDGGLPAHHLCLMRFPFWEPVASPVHDRAHPFASRLGVTSLTRGLALIGMLYTNICSGSETIFGPPDTVPGTLLRVGVGAMVRFPHVLQVSNCLDISWIDYTDRFEWNRANWPRSTRPHHYKTAITWISGL